MSAPWGDGRPERGYLYCSECSGEGVTYNNADPTSGQWVECDCVTLLRANTALLGAAKTALPCLESDNGDFDNAIKVLRKAIAVAEGAAAQ